MQEYWPPSTDVTSLSGYPGVIPNSTISQIDRCSSLRLKILTPAGGVQVTALVSSGIGI